MSMEETGLACVSEDRVINYCLQSKVSKIAIDELLKLGFTSLEALRLVDMSNLVRPKIPKVSASLFFTLRRRSGIQQTTNQQTEQLSINHQRRIP